MNTKNKALITSAAGHGFMELLFAKAYGKEVIACSEKTTKEEFEKETTDIYNRLSSFTSNMKKATWEEAKNLSQQGISYRERLLSEQVNSDMWDNFASTTLSPTFRDDLPKYKGLHTSTTNIMLIPQKLVSDGLCGVNAKQQSVPLEVFDFFKNEKNNKYILGQHFHKQNDIEHVENIAKDFSMYVPGQNEDKEVFGIRGINHDQYLNLYKKTDMSVGIAGTHTWNMLTCFPDIPQIILYNKNGVENWQEISESYRKKGKHIYVLGHDENTDWKKFSLELKALYFKVRTAINKERNIINKKSNTIDR